MPTAGQKSQVDVASLQVARVVGSLAQVYQALGDYPAAARLRGCPGDLRHVTGSNGQ
jgi:hypothetical protein